MAYASWTNSSATTWKGDFLPKVDFWQLSNDPAEKVTALIAGRVLSGGDRLLVVSSQDEQRAEISDALWEASDNDFLANGDSNEPHAERQPILLSAEPEAANGGNHLILADGQWREDALKFERAFLLFGDDVIDAARAAWRGLDEVEGVERSFFRQENGKWLKVA